MAVHPGSTGVHDDISCLKLRFKYETNRPLDGDLVAEPVCIESYSQTPQPVRSSDCT